MKVTRLTLFLSALCGTTIAYANPTAASIGSSITISDGNYSQSGWYGNHEDNETETNPDTVRDQVWDLEGMYMNGSALTLVGGFDFRDGTRYGSYTYKGGDIFIDTTGDAKYTYADNGNAGLGGTVSNSFGYDYVIHFNSGLTSYSVFQIGSTATVSRGLDIQASDPWRYVSGGTAVTGYQNVAIGGYGTLDASAYSVMTTYGSTGPGLLGTGTNNTHYYVSVDTSFLPSRTDSTFHYTIECGNDNLMGRTTTVPDGGSALALLAGGLGTLVAFRRRTRRG